MHNRCRSKDDNVKKEEKTKDVADVQPVANVWGRFSIQPLRIFYAEKKNIQWDCKRKKSQAETNLADLLSAHELFFLFQQTFRLCDIAFGKFIGVEFYNLLLEFVYFCGGVVKSISNHLGSH